jgi:type VI secretion system protein ImpK
MDRINDITADCFNALIQLRQLDDALMPEPEGTHRRLRKFIDSMRQRAAQAGFSKEDVEDITYAVVALADEIMVAKQDPVGAYWVSNLLQVSYFEENVAGEAFFTRLEGIQRNPRRTEVLRVYYLALLFGFTGRYRVRGGELELLTLTEDLQGLLSRGRKFESEMLSPSGERPAESLARGGRSGPLLWISLGAVAFAVLLYVGLRIAVSSSAASVVDRIHAASTP